MKDNDGAADGGRQNRSRQQSYQLSPHGERTSSPKLQRKPPNSSQFLGVRQSRPSIDTISGFSTYSVESLTTIRSRDAQQQQGGENGARNVHGSADLAEEPPATTLGGQAKRRLCKIWEAQKGIILMILAQMFASTMASTARYMETTGDTDEPMSPFQILFVRMTVTMTASLAYMWVAKVPNAPFGARDVRWLLALRGFSGFFGVFGLYFSLIYLPLAEATVLTFMAPLLAAWLSSMLLKTPFTRVHKISAFISIMGVVLIAQPFNFLPQDSASTTPTPRSNTTAGPESTPSAADATPAQRALAVCLSLVGVCGAAGAYMSILKIGKRAHPLISVNYFATWCTIISVGALALAPGTTFRLPHGWREWALMAFLGLSGFVMQFLLTASLSVDKQGSKGLNMVYTQMLFAVAMDKLVFGTTPTWVSLVGSSLILGSAIWVAVAKEKAGAANNQGAQQAEENDEGGAQRVADEEVALVAAADRHDLDDDAVEMHAGQGYVAESHVIGSDDDDDDENEETRSHSR